MKAINNSVPNHSSLSNECPNCWGRQSYCGIIYDTLPIGHIPANSIEKENFIRKFVIQNIDGFRNRLGILPNNR